MICPKSSLTGFFRHVPLLLCSDLRPESRDRATPRCRFTPSRSWSSHRWNRGEQGRRIASESIQTILWWATTTTRRACTKFEENDAVVFVLAYFNYFQYRTTEVAECTARYNVLRKMMIATVPTYLNFLQNQSTEDARTITRFYALQNTKDTKSFALTDKSEKKMAKKNFDVTQAGSD